MYWLTIYAYALPLFIFKCFYLLKQSNLEGIKFDSLTIRVESSDSTHHDLWSHNHFILRFATNRFELVDAVEMKGDGDGRCIETTANWAVRVKFEKDFPCQQFGG